MTTALHASCSHVLDHLCFDREPFEVYQDRGDGRWFAQHPDLGVGHGFSTPEKAVVGLLHHHGCTSIHLTESGSPETP